MVKMMKVRMIRMMMMLYLALTICDADKYIDRVLILRRIGRKRHLNL